MPIKRSRRRRSSTSARRRTAATARARSNSALARRIPSARKPIPKPRVKAKPKLKARSTWTPATKPARKTKAKPKTSAKSKAHAGWKKKSQTSRDRRNRKLLGGDPVTVVKKNTPLSGPTNTSVDHRSLKSLASAGRRPPVIAEPIGGHTPEATSSLIPEFGLPEPGKKPRKPQSYLDAASLDAAAMSPEFAEQNAENWAVANSVVTIHGAKRDMKDGGPAAVVEASEVLATELEQLPPGTRGSVAKATSGATTDITSGINGLGKDDTIQVVENLTKAGEALGPDDITTLSKAVGSELRTMLDGHRDNPGEFFDGLTAAIGNDHGAVFMAGLATELQETDPMLSAAIAGSGQEGIDAIMEDYKTRFRREAELQGTWAAFAEGFGTNAEPGQLEDLYQDFGDRNEADHEAHLEAQARYARALPGMALLLDAGLDGIDGERARKQYVETRHESFAEGERFGQTPFGQPQRHASRDEVGRELIDERNKDGNTTREGLLRSGELMIGTHQSDSGEWSQGGVGAAHFDNALLKKAGGRSTWLETATELAGEQGTDTQKELLASALAQSHNATTSFFAMDDIDGDGVADMDLDMTNLLLQGTGELFANLGEEEAAVASEMMQARLTQIADRPGGMTVDEFLEFTDPLGNGHDKSWFQTDDAGVGDWGQFFGNSIGFAASVNNVVNGEDAEQRGKGAVSLIGAGSDALGNLTGAAQGDHRHMYQNFALERAGQRLEQLNGAAGIAGGIWTLTDHENLNLLEEAKAFSDVGVGGLKLAGLGQNAFTQQLSRFGYVTGVLNQIYGTGEALASGDTDAAARGGGGIAGGLLGASVGGPIGYSIGSLLGEVLVGQIQENQELDGYKFRQEDDLEYLTSEMLREIHGGKDPAALDAIVRGLVHTEIDAKTGERSNNWTFLEEVLQHSDMSFEDLTAQLAEVGTDGEISQLGENGEGLRSLEEALHMSFQDIKIQDNWNGNEDPELLKRLTAGYIDELLRTEGMSAFYDVTAHNSSSSEWVPPEHLDAAAIKNLPPEVLLEYVRGSRLDYSREDRHERADRYDENLERGR